MGPQLLGRFRLSVNVELSGATWQSGVFFTIRAEACDRNAVLHYNQGGVGLFRPQSEIKVDLENQHA